MRTMVTCGILLAGMSGAAAEPVQPPSATLAQGVLPAQGETHTTTEFASASGKPLGSVTTIAGTTYYAAPDGTPIGASTIRNGRRVFISY